jgi:hypothetical protein
MTRRNFALVISLIPLAIIISAVTYLLVEHQAFLIRRHHLLCEVMQPSMSRNDALSVLRQVGDFTANEYDSTDRFFALDIQFTDPRVLKRYGYFSIVFIDNGYARAVVPHGSDNSEFICDFYQVTAPATWTP